MTQLNRILPSRSVLELFLLTAFFGALADCVFVLKRRPIAPDAWGGFFLVSMALFPVLSLPQAFVAYVALGLAGRARHLSWLGNTAFRGGFSAVLSALAIPAFLMVNVRRPGFSLSGYHLGAYLGVAGCVLLAAGVAATALWALERPLSALYEQQLRRVSWSAVGIFAATCAIVASVSAFQNSPGPRAGGTRGSLRPNAILISIDTLRADHLGVYGYPKPTDAEIRRHFRDGLVFRDAVAPVPQTRPSHTAMLTGIHPARLGVFSNYDRFGERMRTLAQILQQNGYRTAAFVSGWPLFGETSGLDRGFDHYSDAFSGLMRIHPAVADLKVPMVLQKLRRVDFLQRSAYQVTDDALEWTEEQLTEPFFLFVHYYDPHSYYEAPSPYREEMGVPANAARNNRWIASQILRGARELDAETEALAPRLYDAEIRFADSQVGRLLDRIDALGLRDRTIVLLTADHGETLLERVASDGVAFAHGRWLDERDIRIPFLLRGPGVPTGTSSITATLDDIAPTLLGLIGLDPPAGMTGGDLLAGEGGAPAVSFNSHLGETDLVSVRADGYKYIIALDSGAEQLIDLRSLAGRTDVIELRRDLAKRLRQIALELPLAHTRDTVDPHEAERLRALGYIQ